MRFDRTLNPEARDVSPSLFKSTAGVTELRRTGIRLPEIEDRELALIKLRRDALSGVKCDGNRFLRAEAEKNWVAIFLV